MSNPVCGSSWKNLYNFILIPSAGDFLNIKICTTLYDYIYIKYGKGMMSQKYHSQQANVKGQTE